MQHRRAQIIDGVAALFQPLLQPPTAFYPFQFKTILKQFMHWTSLDKQGAIPALLITYGSGGGKPDADVIGFTDERYPLDLTVVLKETSQTPLITNQVSDVHYSLERLVNGDRTFGVAGVLPEYTQLGMPQNSKETLYPYLLLRFQLIVVHRYRKNTAV